MIVAILIALAVTRSLATPQPQCRSVALDANFDDLAAPVGVGTQGNVPAGYKGLYFQGITAVRVIETGVGAGVLPHSPPNLGVVSVASQTMAGTAMITTNYPNTNTTSFSLQDFYFGCVVNLLNSESDVPMACNINIAGYKGNDNQVANAQQVCARQFQYNPSTSLGVQEMAFTGPIDGCSDVQFVIITFSPVGGMSALASTYALGLDNIRFTSKKC